MPADQLNSVAALQSERPTFLAGTIVHILEGFTSIDTLEVSSPGHLRVRASLTDVQSALSVKVDTLGDVSLKSANLKSLAVHEGTVLADVDGSVDNLDVSGISGGWTTVYLSVAGGIKNGSVHAVHGGKILLEANSTVTGKMMTVSGIVGGSPMDTGDRWDGSARVVLPSCANVSTSDKATCTEKAPIDMISNWPADVHKGFYMLNNWSADWFKNTSRQPTHKGTHTCAVSAYGDSNTDGNTSSSGLTLTASLVVLLAVATSFMV